jgi:nucleotide-binding universal stress UspA family protein
MNTANNNDKRFVLVVGVDETAYADRVLADAVAVARERPNVELHIVHVLDLGREFVMTPLLNGGREHLDRMGKMAVESCDARVSTHLGVGRPWRELVQTATNVQADLIVVGTHGRSGLSRLLIGSQAERVVRHAACPVLVVREKDYGAREVPEIEPACPECLKVQAETKGEQLWCSRHAEHHPRPHRHYEFPEGYGRGSMFVRSE